METSKEACLKKEKQKQAQEQEYERVGREIILKAIKVANALDANESKMKIPKKLEK